MREQRITPRLADWLIALAVVFLALVGLAMLDEYDRIEADTAAMQAATARIQMMREARP